MSIYNHFQVIYKITNHITGKVYIGSTVNVVRRQNQHIICLINNRHINNKLQNSWNKYTWKAFSFQIIEKVFNFDELSERELYHIIKNDSIKNGFNIAYPEQRKDIVGYKERKEKRIKSDKKYYDDNIDKIKQLKNKYYDDNKDRIRESQRLYRENNKEKVKDIRNKYNKENREKLNEYQRKYYNINKEKIKERNRIYQYNKKSTECGE